MHILQSEVMQVKQNNASPLQLAFMIDNIHSWTKSIQWIMHDG